MKRMRDSHDDLYSAVARDSLLGLISDREYLKDPISLLVARICELLNPAIGMMFGANPPKNETRSEHQNRDSLELARDRFA